MMWLVAVGKDTRSPEFRAPMSAGAHPRFREVPPLRLHLAIVQVHRFRGTRGSSPTPRTAFSPTRQDSLP